MESNKVNSKRNTTYCSVAQCHNYKTEEISFHHFPKDDKLKKQWEIALKMGKSSSTSMRVCSEHFLLKDFFFQGNKKRHYLKSNVIPTQKLPIRLHDIQETSSQKQNKEAREQRIYCRRQKRNKSFNLPDANNDENNDVVQSENNFNTYCVDHAEKEEFLSYADKATQTFIPQCLSLNETTSKRFLLDFINDRVKLNTFTGLHSFELLDGIVECVSDLEVNNVSKRKEMDLKNRVTLTFVKLKQNLSFSALAVLFDITRQTCTNYFKNMIPLLSLVLKTILPWPDKEIIRSNMPIAFKNFNTTRIIMDCAEIRIEKPHCVKCRILTYSNYKKCHTIKWNVAVTPSGLIVHISSSYGGRASDKFIVIDSGILNKLDPYDAVMVDRGFLIENECLQRHLTLIQPPFLKKKPKFSKTEALRTAEIARARVHVERVIQRIREFSFMSDEVPWNLIPYFDDILIIVAAIVNLSAPVLNIDKFL